MTGPIVASLVLIVAAAVTLVFGWAGADQALVVASIAASAAAALAMVVAYARSKEEVDRSR